MANKKNQLDSLTKGGSEAIEDLLESINLVGKSKDEITQIRSFLEDALSDRVNFFILKNLQGEKLSEYESLLDEKKIDAEKIGVFIRNSIENFEERLEKNLQDFQQEIINKFSN